MEHLPWVGDNFKKGLGGKTYLLFGYSHYGTFSQNEPDSPNFTKQVIETWGQKGELAFFNAIAGYFGFTSLSSVKEFYDHVAFANILPRSVGASEDKFAFGSAEAISEVSARVRKLLFDVDADKAIVFSTKGWSLFPYYDDIEPGGDRWLEIPGYPTRTYGGYNRKSGGYCSTYGLRHTMAASKEMMRASVKAIMAHDHTS